MTERIELSYRRGSQSAAELQAEIDRLWQSIDQDPDLLAAAKAAGLDLSQLSRERSPVTVDDEAAGFEPVSILIIVGGIVARDLWREVLLPRIKERYGADAVQEERGERHGD